MNPERRITAPKPERKRRDVGGFDRPSDRPTPTEPPVVELRIDIDPDPVVDVEIVFESANDI